MKQLKEVKKQFKINNKYKELKKTFPNKKIKLVLTKVSFIFDSKIKGLDLYPLELKLLIDPSEKSYRAVYKKVGLLMKSKYNWEELGTYMYYQAQTKFYWRKKMTSVYTDENFISLNAKRRKAFNLFAHSVNDNTKIMYLLKRTS